MKTKDQILHLTITLIQERGDLGWSYEDIATKVGIRKASIHYYFPKKKDLILEATRIYIARVVSEVQKALKHASHIREKIASVTNCYRQIFFQKNRLCLCLALSLNLSRNNDPLLDVLKNFFRTMHQILFDILKEGQESGEIKNINPDSMATTILALLQGLLLLGEHGWSKKHFDNSLNQIMDLL